MKVHLWRTMKYQCGVCHAEILMFLEDGCEGPRDKPVEIMVPFFATPDRRTEKRTAYLTASGRAVIPVPFTIRCPCHPKAYKSHVRWTEDQDIDLTVDESDAAFPYFRYDLKGVARGDQHACGVPRNHLAAP